MNKDLYGTLAEGQRRTWAWAVPVLVLVFMISGQILALLPAKFLGLITRDNVETYPQVLYLIIGAFAMVALIFVLWIRLFERRPLSSAGLALRGDKLEDYVRGFAYGLLMAASVVGVVWMLGGYVIESETGPGAADLVPIIVLMFAFILQSGTEEFVFRGWMMGRLAERWGLWVGVIGNSVLFSLMHVDSDRLLELGASGIAIFVLGTMLFSIFLSLLAIREKSVWGAAAWHAAWNWMFITWFGLPTTGIELGLAPLAADLMPTPDAAVWLTGGIEGPEGSFMTPVVLAAGCLVLFAVSAGVRGRREAGV